MVSDAWSERQKSLSVCLCPTPVGVGSGFSPHPSLKGSGGEQLRAPVTEQYPDPVFKLISLARARGQVLFLPLACEKLAGLHAPEMGQDFKP